MKTTVVNIHKIRGITPEFDVYIGREIRDHRTGEVRYEASPWANPHLSLPEYEIYINRKIREDPVIYDLRELAGKRLGCWCINTNKILPLVCHGQVLLKLIREAGFE